MKPQQADDLKNLWEAKLADQQKARIDAFDTCYAGLAVRGIANGGSTPGHLYQIAIDSLGALNQIFRENFEDGWAIDEDANWAKTRLEQYVAFNANEKKRIDREISDFLTSKSYVDNPPLLAAGKARLELSNRVHTARFDILVHQRISEHERKAMDLERSDSRWKQEHIIRISTIIILLLSTFIATNSYRRTQRLFIGEDQPQVQAIPFAIGENEKHNSTINFQMVNYTGFDAKNVSVDVKYCGADKQLRHWAGEWAKAEAESKDKKSPGVVEGHGYLFNAGSRLDLPAFSSVDAKEHGFGIAADALNLESGVCKNGDSGFPVLVRVRWENEKGRVFDEIHKYKLLCTKNWIGKNKPSGRAFTMTLEPGISCAPNEL